MYCLFEEVNGKIAHPVVERGARGRPTYGQCFSNTLTDKSNSNITVKTGSFSPIWIHPFTKVYSGNGHNTLARMPLLESNLNALFS